jgi:copper chaperone CopZ
VRETKDLPGVVSVTADVATKTATFAVDSASTIGTIKQTLIEIGYPPAEAAGSRA